MYLNLFLDIMIFFFPGIEDLYDSPTIHLVGGVERGSEYSKKD